MTPTIPPIPIQTVALNGSYIAYRQYGSGNATPVLLLHGWGSSSRYWQTTLADLGTIRTIYAPDLPGYGKSPPHANIADPESMAHLVMSFADEMGLEQFDLNGHSFSAVVASYIAYHWKHRVRRLVLTCPCTYRNEIERIIVRYIHYLTAVWMAMRRPWMVGKVWLYRFVARSFFYRIPHDGNILRAIFDDFFCMDRNTAIQSALSAANPGYNELLQQIQVPSLIIGSRQDRVMPGYGASLVAQRIPQSRLAWIERCGHLPMAERPTVYHQLLQEFLHHDE